MMFKNNNYGFTLIELIVVITILIILGTISFISFNGYVSSSRDSKRISDISNIKKSLELFIIKTGKYPTPDNSISASFSGELLWKQGTIGNKVYRNLSKNLKKKPVDPKYNNEYTYSITNIGNEYEIMGLFESDIAYNNKISNQTYAKNKNKIKIKGNYNGLFIITRNFLFPTPSIIGAFENDIDLKNNNKIDSIVIDNGKNIPNLKIPGISTSTGNIYLNLSTYKSINKKSSDEDKVNAIDKIQKAFSGTSIQNKKLYKMVLSKKTYKEKLQLANWIFGGGLNEKSKEAILSSCEIDGNVINSGNTITAYSENLISTGATYDCQSISSQRTCDNGTFTGDEIYKYSSCSKGIPQNCNFSYSFSYNSHYYNIPSLNHGESIGLLISESVNENNGTYQYSLNNITCNDGNYININESQSLTLLNCDNGFHLIGDSCVSKGEININSQDTLVCPYCTE